MVPAPVVEGTPIAIESAPLLDEEDKRFKQLLDAFNQRVNDIRRKKAEGGSGQPGGEEGHHGRIEGS
jgi:hypothetical protein